MALNKVIAAYLNDDGSWAPQKEVRMHPLEEEAILKEWAINDVKSKIPPKPTQEDEHEMLIQHGPDYVKQKRAEWQAIHDSVKPELDAAHNAHLRCHNNWNEHVELCLANGHNPDTYPTDARLTLKKP